MQNADLRSSLVTQNVDWDFFCYPDPAVDFVTICTGLTDRWPSAQIHTQLLLCSQSCVCEYRYKPALGSESWWRREEEKREG